MVVVGEFVELIRYASENGLPDVDVRHVRRLQQQQQQQQQHCTLPLDTPPLLVASAASSSPAAAGGTGAPPQIRPRYCEITSSPEWDADRDLALVDVSKVALADVHAKRLLQIRYTLLSKDEDVLERVPHLVANHPEGVLTVHLEDEYLAQYHQRLPVYWLPMVVDACPTVHVERLVGDLCQMWCEVVQGQQQQQQPLLRTIVTPSSGSVLRAPFAMRRGQNLEQSAALDDMMEHLQASYKDSTFGNLNLEDVQRGNLYAARWDADGRFHRVSVVVEVTDPCCVSVYYVDFGYRAVLTLQHLFRIGDLVLTALPYQAVKARLGLVKPNDPDGFWSTNECTIFRNTVFLLNLLVLNLYICMLSVKLLLPHV